MASTLGTTTFICVSVGKTPEYQVMHFIMFFIDGTSTIADLVLLQINKRQEKRYIHFSGVSSGASGPWLPKPKIFKKNGIFGKNSINHKYKKPIPMSIRK
jgi:hypothetical protein